MQTPDNINLTVMATIGVAYMQRHEDPALRIMQLETIVAALSALLQCVGRPPFMNSIFHLWSGLTHSLVIFEHMLFPEQEIQTPPARALPQANSPLTAIQKLMRLEGSFFWMMDQEVFAGP